MVAQRGTLNIVAAPASAAQFAGAHLVLSTPVSALQGVDDNHDGLLSASELQRHAASIEDQLRAQVQQVGKTGTLPLQGLMWQDRPTELTFFQSLG